MPNKSEHIERSLERIADFKKRLQLLNLSEDEMQKKAEPKKWSGNEICEHLVVMWQSYKPQIEQGLQKAKKYSGEEYKPGWFGSWFAKQNGPTEGKGMKTASIFEPSNYQSELTAVQRLIEVQDELSAYVNKMREVNINKTRVSSPASKFIRFKIGDAVEILLNHQDRHWQQLMRTLGREE